MRLAKHQVTSGEDLFVGIDLHKHRWHVTIRTFDVELLSASIPGTWESLQRILARYAGHQLKRRSMKPDILASGFMTAWWLMASPVWLLLPVWFPRNTATGSRPIVGTAVSWRICWPRGC